MNPDKPSSLEKSPDFEDFLQQLNGTLAGTFRPPVLNGASYISAQIVGLPRSGTTIVYQLMARTRCVGYPSNLMALFWETPTVGARIQQHLALQKPTLSLESFAGRTREPMDPHEFGYFWRSMLGHSGNSLEADSETKDLKQLGRWLNAISNIFSAPVVYKNFLGLAHAVEMRESLDNTRFIVTERPLIDIAASLLSLRRRLGYRRDEWIGVRPSNTDPKWIWSDIGMVAFQVADLERIKYESNLSGSPDSISVSYNALCNDTRKTVGELLEFLKADKSLYRPHDLPSSLESGSGIKQLDYEEGKLLQSALDSALAQTL